EGARVKQQRGLRQERGTGGTGVFFVGKKDEKMGTTSYQFIELLRRRGATGPEFLLSRGRGSITRPAKGNPVRVETALASSILAKPPGNREYVLEIRITPQGLVRVT